MQEENNNKEKDRNALSKKNDKSKEYADLWKRNSRLRKNWIKARNTSSIYSHIANALARDCTDLFYVNMDTGEFIEYRTDDEHGMLHENRRASDFYESCQREAKLFVHPDDQNAFVTAMNHEFLVDALEKSNVFEMTYRRIKDGKTFYVQMKVSHMGDDNRFIVIAVFDIDELVMKRRAEERIQEERIIYARLHAITGNFLVVYVVEPETGFYHEFSSTDEYVKSFGQPKEGSRFFEMIRGIAPTYNHPEDVQLFLSAFTEENVYSEIERSGIFTLGFRLMMRGKARHVQMKAAMVEEKEGLRLIVGLNDIDVQVRQEEKIKKRLLQAQSQAKIDALTGVKNRHAYLETESRIDRQIAENCVEPFAIVMMDLNDLKKINDTAGHQSGDQYLRDACKIICDIFKHSPVFRVGGDEFAVIAQGNDYLNLDKRLEEMADHNMKALASGGIVIACGMSRFDNDICTANVFERADQNMYTNKTQLKSGSVSDSISL